MARLRRSVPSLGALVVFEAAARLGGFTKAANELGVTQAAVSRRIRALEADLKVKLFVRTPRQVVLTDAGRALSEAVGNAFD
ncbi:MAG: LysR family transcriptional regulator, partial [Pseudomonadota bacterium]